MIDKNPLHTHLALPAILLAALFLAACSTGISNSEPPATAETIALQPQATLTAVPPTSSVPTDTPAPEPAETAEPTKLAATETVVPTETALPAEAPTSTPVATSEGPLSLTINADGSGDLATLEEALAFAAGGSTIMLSPGAFDLPRTVELDKPLTISGAGRDETRIITQAQSAGISYGGDGVLAMNSLTLRHEGPDSADVINLHAGELHLESCRIEGGRRAPSQAFFGAGIFARNEAVVQAADCEFINNEGAGVEGIHTVQINVRNSFFSGNGSGLLLDGSSTGKIDGNLIQLNDGAGIYLFGQAAPEISSNIIRENSEYGISYDLDGPGGGKAEGNQLFNNYTAAAQDPGTDIIIYDNASPDLAGNICSGEGHSLPPGPDTADSSGIVFFHRGFAPQSDNDPASNDCAHAVCSLGAGESDFEIQCISSN